MKLFLDKKGTTLIEVIAAVTLLVVALLPIMDGIADSNNVLIQTGKKAKAFYLAQQEIETKKVELKKDAKQNSGKIPISSNSDWVSMSGSNNGFSKKLVVTEVYGGTYNLAQLEVTVRWGVYESQQIRLITQVTGDI